MKTCICCSTPASVDALTCAKCGEGSWSTVESDERRDADTWPAMKIEAPAEEGLPPIAIEVGPHVPTDPDTKIEVPMKRRGGKKPS